LNPIQEIVKSKQLERSTVKNEEKTFNSTQAKKKKEIELPLKENVKIKQNELEKIKVKKIKSKKEPTSTSIANAKIKSRNIERNSVNTLDLSIKDKEFNRQQAHFEIKRDGVEIKKKAIYISVLSQKKVQQITDNQSKCQDDNDIKLEKMEEDKIKIEDKKAEYRIKLEKEKIN